MLFNNNVIISLTRPVDFSMCIFVHFPFEFASYQELARQCLTKTTEKSCSNSFLFLYKNECLRTYCRMTIKNALLSYLHYRTKNDTFTSFISSIVSNKQKLIASNSKSPPSKLTRIGIDIFSRVNRNRQLDQ